jgi:phosphatidylserine decarboxylase
MVLFGRHFYIHGDGVKFICTFAALALIFMTFSHTFGWIFVLVTLFCAYFFRNPRRVVPLAEGAVVCPADGVVSAITLETPPSDIGIGNEELYRVSVFLSMLDVHVNRIPFAGVVKSIFYHPGSFLNASLDKSSVFNEKNTIVLTLKSDPSKFIALTQIAGMIARRIVCDIHEGQEVQKGSVFGIIRFGSRCDVWLPAGIVPEVMVGQTVVAGETVIADIFGERKELAEGTTI